MTDAQERLTALRRQLDELDANLVQTLAMRESVVRSVGALKSGSHVALRDLAREESLIGRAVGLAREQGADPLLVTRVFQAILDQSVRRQLDKLAAIDNPERGKPILQVGYQGGLGSYSHAATTTFFSTWEGDARLRGYPSFRAMLEDVRDAKLDYCVLPIENTTAGSINRAYDLLAELTLSIVGEVIHPVQHCLIGLGADQLDQIQVAWSHPQALAQCSDFLESRGIRARPSEDTAGSVAQIMELGNPAHAAIASADAAALYGLPILARDIANQRQNFTRMVVVGVDAATYDSRIPCKTSVILATGHHHGALLEVMSVFADNSLNLTKLESRPRKGSPFEYLFYVDFEGNVAEPTVQSALEQLRSVASFVRVLGSYPRRTGEAAQPAQPRLPTPRPPRSVGADKSVRIGRSVVGRGHSRWVRCATADEVWAAAGAGADGVIVPPGIPQVVADLPMARVTQDVSELRADDAAVYVESTADLAVLNALGQQHRPVFLERSPLAAIDTWVSQIDAIRSAGNQQVVGVAMPIPQVGGGAAWVLTDLLGLNLPVVVNLSDAEEGTERHRLQSAVSALGLAGVVV